MMIITCKRGIKNKKKKEKILIIKKGLQNEVKQTFQFRNMMTASSLSIKNKIKIKIINKAFLLELPLVEYKIKANQI